MGMEQETLIYVEENDREEAKILTKGLLNKDVKSRAYINALGAELGLKYLALENINSSKTYNLHNVHKILEEFDISDIMLANIHIDVRVVFDENNIFIPKSHFEFDILPDIYLVFVLAEDSSHVKFIGFFEPKLINKNNHNADYYFIEKEKLSSPLNLKEFVDSFKGNTTESLSNEVNETAQTLMLSVVDQNASKDEIKELLKYLTKSSYLRDRFIEFENFEILSYKAERSPDVTIPQEVAQESIIDATIDDLKMPEEPLTAEAVEDLLSETEENVSGLPQETFNPAVEELAAPVEDVPEIPAPEALLGQDIQAEEQSLTPEAVTENSVEDVTDMFTNSSAPDLLDNIPDSMNLSVDAVSELPSLEMAETPALGMELPKEEIVSEEIISVEEFTNQAEANHDFVESSANDFFDGLEETTQDESVSFESIDTSKPLVSAESSISMDAVDFDSVEKGEMPRPDDMPSENEMEILDISNVNAVPNNLDQNISETIEFNNIELSNSAPCLNELNGENTSPVLDMNNFSPLEPLDQSESFKAESYDMDSISITDNMLQMPPRMEPLPMSDSSFEPVDMESLNGPLTPLPQAQVQETKPEEDSSNELVLSELDSIPDFDGNMQGFGALDDPMASEQPVSQNQPEEIISEQAPISNELDSIPSVEALSNFSEEDIVEAPADETVESEDLVTDFEALSTPKESDSDLSTADEIPALGEEPAGDDVDGIPELGDEVYNEDLISEAEETVQEEGAIEAEEGAAQDGDLTMLFSDASEQEEVPQSFNELNNFSEVPSLYQSKPKVPMKMFAVAAVAAVLAIGGVVGFSMKNKGASSEPEPLAQAVPENIEQPAPVEDNTNILANTPEVQTLPAPQKEPVNVKKDAPEAKQTQSDKPVNPQGTYMSVKKLSWEVPDYLSYSANIQKYLQTAGKSIKLTLSSDLLLVSEYAYSNQMKVDLQLSSDGNLKDSKIIKSSGSKQIDKIVLQTVKETLNVIKPATGEVPTAEFHLALIINF